MNSGKRRTIYLAIIALSLTNVSVMMIGEYSRLMLFWPVLLVAILSNLGYNPQYRFPPYSLIFLLSTISMVVSFLANRANSEISTAVFSLTWVIYWGWIILIRRLITTHQLRRTLEWVILIYFAFILASFLLTVLNVYELPLPEFMGRTEGAGGFLPRFYGPTTEPSYAALILGAAWLGICRIAAGEDGTTKTRRRIVLAALFMSLLALQSIYGLLVALLVVSTMLGGFTTRVQRIGFLALGLLALPFLPAFVPPDTRLGLIIAQIPSMSLYNLQTTDNSAFMRIGPFYEMISNNPIMSMPFWLGHGAGVSEFYFGNIFGYTAGGTITSLNLGFLPSFIYDFGLVSSILVVTYLMLICKGRFSFQARTLVLIALFNCNFNTHLFWFIASCFFLSAPLIAPRMRQLARYAPVYQGRAQPVTAHVGQGFGHSSRPAPQFSA